MRRRGKTRNPEILATGQIGKANEGRQAVLRVRRCRPLQLCLCGNAASVCGVPELGKRPELGGGSQQSNAMQTIEGDDDADIAPSMDSILDPNF